MSGEKYIRKKLSQLDGRTNPELLRVELYSCITFLFLSTDYFPNNIDIEEFNNSVDVKFRKYVYLSRTVIVGRMLRVLEKAEHKVLISILNQLKDEVFKDLNLSSDGKKSNKNKKNYVDSLIDQFPRTD